MMMNWITEPFFEYWGLEKRKIIFVISATKFFLENVITSIWKGLNLIIRKVLIQCEISEKLFDNSHNCQIKWTLSL